MPRALPLTLILAFLAASAFADGDKASGTPPTPPNQVEASPTPQEIPVRPVAVPRSTHTPGAPALSPENGSAMGLGIQIPFGKKYTPQPEATEDDGSGADQATAPPPKSK